MSKAGYVYALLNPSMENLVKIGKTGRDPRSRSSELSAATGVPTPFVLAFSRFFDDCQSAEQFVHVLLERQGYRVSGNREFFRAPLHEAVDAILQAGDSGSPNLRSSVPPDDGDDLVGSVVGDEFLDSLDLSFDDSPATHVLEEADCYYYGTGDTLEDHAEAMRLYKQAARLGAARAYRSLGSMYARGEGCTRDRRKALEFWKEGAKKGDSDCYAEMACLFSEDKQDANAQKCWRRFFSDPAAVRSNSIGLYGERYLVDAREHEWSLDFIDALRGARDEVIATAERFVQLARERNPEYLAAYEANLQYIRRLLDVD